ncbi:MAG: hypothetical protein HY059_23075 [Proteobacteria bacterium]|nr:hypothetical protein [Pseudomonadota bacterium]
MIRIVLAALAAAAFAGDAGKPEARPASGRAPLRVSFEGLAPDWYIDFGDGTTYTVQGGGFTQPVAHIYGWTGPFTATLKPSNRQLVVNVLGSDIPTAVYEKTDELKALPEFKTPGSTVQMSVCRYGAETIYTVRAAGGDKMTSEVWHLSPSGGVLGRARVPPKKGEPTLVMKLERRQLADCLPLRRPAQVPEPDRKKRTR